MKILLALLISLFSTSLFASDEKPGRFFEDQPDVNDDYWGHTNKNCPDLQDSVYFTPTSDTPYDPFEVICLPKEKWKVTKHNYENYTGTHFDQCFYRRNDANAPWQEELGVVNN